MFTFNGTGKNANNIHDKDINLFYIFIAIFNHTILIK